MPTNSSAKHQLQNRAPHLSPGWVPHFRDGPIVVKAGWAAILLALLLCPYLKAQPTLILSGATLTAISSRTNTILHLSGERIPLKRDNTVAPWSQPTLKLVAELPGKAILLTDTYPSRAGGLSRCQAGEEQFLRLITLSPTPRESFHLKLASCRDNIELTDDGLSWSANGGPPFTMGMLTIHWLNPPSDPTQPRTLAIHIGPDGLVMKPLH